MRKIKLVRTNANEWMEKLNLSSIGRLQQERHCLEMENCFCDIKWCVPVLGKKIDTVSLALS